MFKTHDSGHIGVGVIIFIYTTVAAVVVCTLVPMLALTLACFACGFIFFVVR